MDDKEKAKVLKLYPEFDTVYGPYIRKEDGRAMVVLSRGKKQSSRQLAKVRIEVSLGRRLVAGETVDHKDDDLTNDKLENLQVLGKVENAAKFHRRDGRFVRIDHDQFCSVCEKPFRNHLKRQTCLSKSCKSILRSKINLSRGVKPPSYDQSQSNRRKEYLFSIFQT